MVQFVPQSHPSLRGNPPQMAERGEIQINDPDYYMSEPKRQITCTVATHADYDALTTALTSSGVDPAGIKVLHGPQGAKIMDMSGEGHGFIAYLRRLFPMVDPTVLDHMAAAEDVLNADGYALAVPAAELEGAETIAGTYRNHNAANIVYFAKNKMWKLQ